MMYSQETGIIDVGEWQAAVDMRTGQSLAKPPTEHAALSELLGRSPFPGDLSPRSASWVTDLALELNRLYTPTLIVLVHASLSFKTMFGEADAAAAEAENIRSEVERFISASGLDYIVLGLGNLVRLEGFVDLSGVDGLALGSGFPSTYAGVYRPSSRDLEYLEGLNEVTRIVGIENFREQFGGSDLFYRRFPEYLLELEQGYAVKAFGVPAREPACIPSKDEFVPMAGGSGPSDIPLSLTDLKDHLDISARRAGRTALIIIEGLGTGGFPWPYQAVANNMGWFRYTLGDAQYLALSSGKHMVEHGHPPCLRYYAEDDFYPYSGVFNQLPSGLIGQEVEGLTVSVGNRSIYTHACLGADISVECFARTLYNYGTLAVIRPSDRICGMV